MKYNKSETFAEQWGRAVQVDDSGAAVTELLNSFLDYSKELTTSPIKGDITWDSVQTGSLSLEKIGIDIEASKEIASSTSERFRDLSRRAGAPLVGGLFKRGLEEFRKSPPSAFIDLERETQPLKELKAAAAANDMVATRDCLHRLSGGSALWDLSGVWDLSVEGASSEQKASGMRKLMALETKGSQDCVRFLFSHALHDGDIHTTRSFLEAGCSPNEPISRTRSSYEETSLYPMVSSWARGKNHEKIRELLVEFGGSEKLEASQREDPVVARRTLDNYLGAGTANTQAILEWTHLLSDGPKENVQTALQVLATRGLDEQFKILLKKNPTVDLSAVPILSSRPELVNFVLGETDASPETRRRLVAEMAEKLNSFTFNKHPDEFASKHSDFIQGFRKLPKEIKSAVFENLNRDITSPRGDWGRFNCLLKSFPEESLAALSARNIAESPMKEKMKTSFGTGSFVFSSEFLSGAREWNLQISSLLENGDLKGHSARLVDETTRITSRARISMKDIHDLNEYHWGSYLAETSRSLSPQGIRANQQREESYHEAKKLNGQAFLDITEGSSPLKKLCLLSVDEGNLLPWHEIPHSTTRALLRERPELAIQIPPEIWDSHPEEVARAFEEGKVKPEDILVERDYLVKGKITRTSPGTRFLDPEHKFDQLAKAMERLDASTLEDFLSENPNLATQKAKTLTAAMEKKHQEAREKSPSQPAENEPPSAGQDASKYDFKSDPVYQSNLRTRVDAFVEKLYRISQPCECPTSSDGHVHHALPSGSANNGGRTAGKLGTCKKSDGRQRD